MGYHHNMDIGSFNPVVKARNVWQQPRIAIISMIVSILLVFVIYLVILPKVVNGTGSLPPSLTGISVGLTGMMLFFAISTMLGCIGRRQ